MLENAYPAQTWFTKRRFVGEERKEVPREKFGLYVYDDSAAVAGPVHLRAASFRE